MTNLVVQETALTRAHSDATLIDSWLYERPPTTLKNYRRIVEAFLAAVSKPVGEVTIVDLQTWASGLDVSTASRNQYVKVVKSLLTFAANTRYTTFNVGAAMRVREVADNRNKRVLSEEEVRDMLAAANEVSDRNYALLLLLYTAGLRAAEACGIRWDDLRKQGRSGVVDVLGKGDYMRTVLLPEVTWHTLMAMRPPDVGLDVHVFRSLRSGAMTTKGVWDVVHRAAVDAGIDRPVSPHWLRHACASHALDHGAPVHVVQATLGHRSLATTSIYIHAKPDNSAGMYLEV